MAKEGNRETARWPRVVVVVVVTVDAREGA